MVSAVSIGRVIDRVLSGVAKVGRLPGVVMSSNVLYVYVEHEEFLCSNVILVL